MLYDDPSRFAGLPDVLGTTCLPLLAPDFADLVAAAKARGLRARAVVLHPKTIHEMAATITGQRTYSKVDHEPESPVPIPPQARYAGRLLGVDIIADHRLPRVNGGNDFMGALFAADGSAIGIVSRA